MNSLLMDRRKLKKSKLLSRTHFKKLVVYHYILYSYDIVISYDIFNSFLAQTKSTERKKSSYTVCILHLRSISTFDSFDWPYGFSTSSFQWKVSRRQQPLYTNFKVMRKYTGSVFSPSYLRADRSVLKNRNKLHIHFKILTQSKHGFFSAACLLYSGN